MITDERKALLDQGFDKFSSLVEDGREKVADNEDMAYIASEVAKRFTLEEFGLYVVSAAVNMAGLAEEAYGEGYFAGSVDAAARIGAQLKEAGFDATAIAVDDEGNETVVVEASEQVKADEVEGTA